MQAIQRGENLTILSNKAEDLRDSVGLIFVCFPAHILLMWFVNLTQDNGAKNRNDFLKIFSLSLLSTGSRIQEQRYTNPTKNVVPEHED
mgnify:CR=1 FL=1